MRSRFTEELVTDFKFLRFRSISLLDDVRVDVQNTKQLADRQACTFAQPNLAFELVTCRDRSH